KHGQNALRSTPQGAPVRSRSTAGRAELPLRRFEKQSAQRCCFRRDIQHAAEREKWAKRQLYPTVMKLCRFQQGNEIRIGLAGDDTNVLDLSAAGVTQLQPLLE